MSSTVLLERLAHTNGDEASMLLWVILWWWQQPVRILLALDLCVVSKILTITS